MSGACSKPVLCARKVEREARLSRAQAGHLTIWERSGIQGAHSAEQAAL